MRNISKEQLNNLIERLNGLDKEIRITNKVFDILQYIDSDDIATIVEILEESLPSDTFDMPEEVVEIPVDEVADVTLLSIKEARKIPEEILKFTNFWWLKSPGKFPNYSSIVTYGGSINKEGSNTNSRIIGIRPALIIRNLNKYNVKPFQLVSIFNKEWYVINEDIVLAKDLDLNTSYEIPCYSRKHSDQEVFWQDHILPDSDAFNAMSEWLKELKALYDKN